MPVTLNKLGSHRPPYVSIGGKSNFGKYGSCCKVFPIQVFKRIVVFKQVLIE